LGRQSYARRDARPPARAPNRLPPTYVSLGHEPRSYSTLFPYTTLFRSDVLDSRTTGFRVSPFLGRVRGERRWRLAAHPPEERRRSEEHTSELQSLAYLVCRLLLEKKKLQHSMKPPSTSLPGLCTRPTII